ncbi:MAG: hypothetical protein KGN76_05065 [Acidobacteriota bacterium]|nr:hypothetical protein [Acidobacteriota bacterium]
MIVVRYAYALALAVWLGGLAILGGIVAPALFSVLHAHDPATGTALAGAVFTAMLQPFVRVAGGAGVVLLISLIVMRLVGPRPVAFGARVAIVLGMLALTFYTGGPIAGQIARLERAVPGGLLALPAGDARRLAFERAHDTASLLLGLSLAGALALLYWEARGD